MAIKFDLNVANWLAHVFDPSVNVSKLAYSTNEKAMLVLFLNKIINSSSSFFAESQVFNDDPDRLKKLMHRLENMDAEKISENFYTELREALGRKQWIALIIPSGKDSVLDSMLCDPELLGYLVKSSHLNQGLILQLEETPGEIASILDLHEAFRIALNDVINWPGILIWSPGGDSIFFPLASAGCLEIDIEGRVQWIFTRLFNQRVFDLGFMKMEYKQSFQEIFENDSHKVNILHLSDLQIGNKISSQRIHHVKSLIVKLIEELGEESAIIPVITGDLLDNPSETHLEQVRQFWGFLSGLGTEEPIYVLGNNDVRKDGNINELYKNAVGFNNSKIVWLEKEKVGLVCINTVMQGNLEVGSVDQEQIEEIEYELVRKKNVEDYKLIVLMHHHPMVHESQAKVTRDFFQKIVGSGFPRTEAIVGSKAMLNYFSQYSVAAYLHGHRHIPLISKTANNVPVVGCGSSIGSVSKHDGSVYFSVNIVSLNKTSEKIATRLLAYRKPSGGLIESKWHEIIFHA